MTTYYIATTGNDSNPGTSASPFLTIQRGLNVSVPGDTVLIKSGTYAPFTSNAASDATIIGKDTGATVIVECAASYSTTYATGTSEYGAKLSNWATGSLTGIQFRNARNQWGAGVWLTGCHGTGPGKAGGNSIVLTDITANNNHSYGILAQNSDHFDIINPIVYKNDTGIEMGSATFGYYIEKPIIHDNDQLVAPGRGGNGIVFYRSYDGLVDGLDPSAYSGGLSYNNRCVSGLYGIDGGHFEQYESYNIQITRMRGWQSTNVIETGQEATTGYRSDGWEIDHNVFYASDGGYPAPLVSGANYGMVIRAMTAGSVHHNTFDGLGAETLLVMNGGSFSGDVTGFTFESNIIWGGGASTRCVSIATGLPSVICDYNDLWNPAGALGIRAGDQTHGINLDPLWVNKASHDYHLTASSPCRGAGA